MSRHRFVRNMDLDDEMNEEEEEGYSQEEQAQMASAMPIARNALKDIKPPISDDAIADSLWHYWFDVEKAVHWLRQDHEKKGEAPHPSLRPTPKEQPRRRPRNLFSSIPSSSSSSDSPQLPLTALQRLSLSRKQATSSSPSPSPAPTATAVSSIENGAKPMSKLALLAQKRKEAAAAAAGQSAENLLRTPTKSPSSSTPASGTQSPISDSASKPLSKLAQKMAAARAAREESAAKAAPTPLSEDTMAIDEPNSTSTVQDGPDIFSAFTIPQTPKSHLSSSSPSTFFSILTSTSSADQNKTDMEITNLHVPLATDISALTKRFEEAFAESPDEVVLRKRQGRAGTADLNTTVKKQAKGTGSKPTSK
ncbi:hypothetical protein V865_008033 [Kwoniella europaea PYCC6329]|uniref:HBS1-like protein N-terminal domain-containing protein n=1 Tax=Kwoniella europaea PYCC6329 TaxID=1423913 RepID=A0AAX4KUQ2_9TREE